MHSNDNCLIVMDIGCRWGFAEKFTNPEFSYPIKVFGFDPDRDECIKLEKSYSHLPQGSVNCIPLALGGAEATRNLYITKEPACSSLHPPRKYLSDNYPALNIIELEKLITVPVVTLESWVVKNQINHIDYIKIDTQGSELEILRGAGKYLNQTRCVDIEVEFNPIYEGQCLFWEIDQYMRSKGFGLWRLSNLVHYSKSGVSNPLSDSNYIHYDSSVRLETPAHGGQLFWADARYVNLAIFEEDCQDFAQKEKDLALFSVLAMTDVVDELTRPNKK